MPVLDLDDFLKKGQQSAPRDTAAPKDSAARPLPAGTPKEAQAGLGRQSELSFEILDSRVGQLFAFKASAEELLKEGGETASLLQARLSALEKANAATLAKADQAVAVITALRPDRFLAEVERVKAQIAYLEEYKKSAEGREQVIAEELQQLKAKSLAAPPAPAFVRAEIPAEFGASIHQLERETIGLGGRLRTVEEANSQLRSWAEREKDYFLKVDQDSIRLGDLERKVALKSELPVDQMVFRAQFDKYVRMADLDRHQLKVSVEDVEATVAGLSASVERVIAMARRSGSSSAPELEPLQAKIDYLESKYFEQSKFLEELKAQGGTEAVEKYSKELERTRSEVSANYEQVKQVEKLLSNQSQRMQEVFAEIQKNLAEYKTTSDMLNSTHDAVLSDIGFLKSEHERKISEYHSVTASLEQHVNENMKVVAELRRALENLLTVEGVRKRMENYDLDKSNLSSLTDRMHLVEKSVQRLAAIEQEQKSIKDEAIAINGLLAEASRQFSSIKAEDSKRWEAYREAIVGLEGKMGEAANRYALSEERFREASARTGSILESFQGEMISHKHDTEKRLSEMDVRVSQALSSAASLSAVQSATDSMKNDFSLQKAEFEQRLGALDSRVGQALAFTASFPILQSATDSIKKDAEVQKSEFEKRLADTDARLGHSIELTKSDLERRFADLDLRVNQGISSISSLSAFQSTAESAQASIAQVQRELEALRENGSSFEARLSKTDGSVQDAISRVAQSMLEMEKTGEKQAAILEQLKFIQANPPATAPGAEFSKMQSDVAAALEEVARFDRVISTQEKRVESLGAQVGGGLSEYRQSFETLKLTRDSVANDVNAFKAEQERRMGEYSAVARTLDEKIGSSATAIATLRRDLDNLLVVEGIKRRLDNRKLDEQNLPSLTERVKAIEKAAARLSEMEREQERLRENSKIINSSLVELSGKVSQLHSQDAEAFKEASRKFAAFESALSDLGVKYQQNSQVVATLASGVSSSLKDFKAELVENQKREFSLHDARLAEALEKAGAGTAELEGRLRQELSTHEAKMDGALEKALARVAELDSRYARDLGAIQSAGESKYAEISRILDSRFAELSDRFQSESAKYSQAAQGFDSRFAEVSGRLEVESSKHAESAQKADSRFSDLTDRLFQAQQAVDQLKAAFDSGSKISDVERQVQSAQSKYSELSGLFDSRIADLSNALKDAFSKQDETKQAYDSKFSEFAGRVAETSRALDPLKSSFDYLQNTAASMQAAIDRLAANSQVKELAEGVDRIHQHMDELDSYCRSLAEELEVVKAASAQSANEAAAASKEALESWKAKSEALSAKADALSAAHGKLLDEQYAAKVAQEGFDKKITGLVDSIGQNQAAIQGLSAAQLAASAGGADLSSKLAKYQDDTNSALADLQQKVNNLILVSSVTKRLEGEAQERSAKALEKLRAAERTLDEIRPAMMKIERMQEQMESERNQVREVLKELRLHRNDEISRGISSLHGQVLSAASVTSQPPEPAGMAESKGQASGAFDARLDDELSALEKAIDEIEMNLASTAKTQAEGGKTKLKEDATGPEKPKVAFGSLLEDLKKARPSAALEGPQKGTIAPDSSGSAPAPGRQPAETPATADAGKKSGTLQEPKNASQVKPAGELSPDYGAQTSADRMALEMMSDLKARLFGDGKKSGVEAASPAARETASK